MIYPTYIVVSSYDKDEFPKVRNKLRGNGKTVFWNDTEINFQRMSFKLDTVYVFYWKTGKLKLTLKNGESWLFDDENAAIYDGIQLSMNEYNEKRASNEKKH